MTKVEFLKRKRFVELEGATAEQMASNAWEVCIPKDCAVFRDKITPEFFDDTTFAIDEIESVFVVGSGVRKGFVVVSVLLP